MDKIKKVMHEYKHHELHSGSKHGPMVTSPSQVKAIAMSEAHESYGDKAKRKGGGHNPMHDGGYGLGRQHDGKTEHGQHIAGGSTSHTYDKGQQNIAGGEGLAHGEKGGIHH